MKGWLVGLALVMVIAASATGLWVTWDSTQTSTVDPVAASSERLITPTTSALRPDTTTTLPPAPPCEAAAEPVTTDPQADWATTVIDPAHGLPADFVPPDLVDVGQAGFATRDQVRA